MSAHVNWGSDESKREPGLHFMSNDADQIERAMQEDQKDHWGFVIYRCTYNSDADWQVFEHSYRRAIRETMGFFKGLDIFDKLDVTIIEDRDTLDGASSATIRNHFKGWCKEISPEEADDPWSNNQRLKFCIRVDEASLETVVRAAQDAESPGGDGGYVDLIWKNWSPNQAAEQEGAARGKDVVEGMRAKDVGFMRVALSFVTGMYCHLRQEYAWDSEYRRPPYVADG
ncbi:hypothetical protein CKM354_000221500 [Cercospora kikuchii]|uniref:Uncharacterized protein n=1 Tax=Cercospora kikuchii TaxID=84275 RepID=A0A9P3C771_9PEZI|nr:uncharacterized protein CKM354_000221500 [Cercospora kikuchii]GIZ38814.1 hypothetical protein CKM354_000221500 [Cercospora kikuchii]